MKNDRIEDINNSINLSFGKIIQRERIKLGKSLKDVEKDLSKNEIVIKDGKEVEEEKQALDHYKNFALNFFTEITEKQYSKLNK